MRYYIADLHFFHERLNRQMDDRGVILSHYLIMCYNGQYRLDAEGNPITYMLYGHVHTKGRYVDPKSL